MPRFLWGEVNWSHSTKGKRTSPPPWRGSVWRLGCNKQMEIAAEGWKGGWPGELPEGSCGSFCTGLDNGEGQPSALPGAQ